MRAANDRTVNQLNKTHIFIAFNLFHLPLSASILSYN